MANVATGKVAFESLYQTDVFNGMDTGKYNIVLTLDDESKAQLENQGVKLKEYEGKFQRKFTSKYPVQVFDAAGLEFTDAVTRGSEVRVKYSLGKPHPAHGTTAYLTAVKVMELAEDTEEGQNGDF